MTLEIEVVGIDVVAMHGVDEEERRTGQRFRIDVTVRVPALETDRLPATIDYRELAEFLRERVASGPPRLLLETLAVDAAAAVLERFPLAEHVRVAIAKPDVRLAGGSAPRVIAEVASSRS